MSEREKTQPGGRRAVLDEALHLSGAFSEADRPRVLDSLSALGPHLARGLLPAEGGGLGQGPGRQEQTVTLRAELPGYPTLVAKGAHRNLDSALSEAKRELIGQLEDEKSGSQEQPAPPEQDLLTRLLPGGDRTEVLLPLPRRPFARRAAGGRRRTPAATRTRAPGPPGPGPAVVRGHRLLPLQVDVVSRPSRLPLVRACPGCVRMVPSTIPRPHAPCRYMKAVSPDRCC